MNKTKSSSFDVIILGAGGAGMMCAAVAGQRGQKVFLIDHAEKAGKKILISGGGRCNFTNLNTPPERFLSANPHLAKSALSRYTPQDFIALVKEHRIAWHEKTLGQLFCDGSAKQIVRMLLDECAKGHVELRLGREVREVDHGDAMFRVSYRDETATAPALVLATGGSSIPKMGATGLAYELARKFGLKVVEPRPALVPLTLGGDETKFRTLSGVSVQVIVRCGRAEFRDAMLFTYKGLSGPAILQISSYWKPGSDIGVNFLPEMKPGWLVDAKNTQPRVSLRAVLAQHLPARLADILAARAGLEGELANITNNKLESITQRLADWQFSPNGSEGFARAEVTIGGIATAGLSSRTMEAKSVAGLYAIGEAVDVTGWLGGYNFQWAWASGWAAGQALDVRVRTH